MKFTPKAEFRFITDSSVREIVEDYHREAVGAFEAGSISGYTRGLQRSAKRSARMDTL